MKNVAIIIGMVILLTGCGGGGGGGSNSPSDQTPTTPTTPIVDHPIFNMVGASIGAYRKSSELTLTCQHEVLQT